ncbi:MAG TPA: hypothetical protein VLM85_05170, partial [Polyangiaceae bacterium]|nr:hypothetical protein [Polyangiaceae bacterium]
MKNFVGLALVLPLIACSGQPSGWNTDAGDDGATPLDDAGNPIVDDSGNPPPPTTNTLATGLPITDIAVYQAVKVTVVKSGSPISTNSRNAPVVAGRDGLVRVFVKPTAPFTHAITGVLTITTGGVPHVVTATLTPKAQSTDAAFSSTFNFNVTGASFAADTTYLVQLKDPQGTGTGDTSAQFPTSGSATALGVQSSGPNVLIKLFPVMVSGGIPPSTGSLDVSAYQRIVQSLYPTPQVTITVMSPVNYPYAAPQPDGTGWDTMLNWMIQKRASDPSPNVYYYGGFAPASDFGSYCSSGCVAGLSSIPNGPSDSQMKASVGLMFGGNSSDDLATGQTMAHEIGHTHGREHSPTSYNPQLGCITPQSLDPSYPYANGSINTWGWDITSSSLVDPSKYFDVMGYCQLDWISDYTYKALFNWIAADNGLDMVGQMTPGTYRMVT